MASSENLASIDASWMMYHRSTFADSSFLSPHDTFTSTNNHHHHHRQLPVDMLSSVLYSDYIADAASLFSNFSSQVDTTNTTPFTPSNFSGSEPDSPLPRVRSGSSAAAGVPSPRSGGKVTKRKSRASKSSQTTYINADPANFRQMVQQVTGVRLDGRSNSSFVPIGSLLKPEPTRASRNDYGHYNHHLEGGGCLPTLDTSSYLLEYQQQNMNSSAMMNNGTGTMEGYGHVATRGATVMAGGDAAAATGFDFEGFSSFPTLESGKVM